MSRKNTITTADYLSWESAMSLIKRLYEDGDYRMCLMATCGCCYGLKISELLSLSWSDILRKEKHLVIEGKIEQSNVITASRFADGYIRKCWNALKIDDLQELCFLNRYGCVISSQMVNRKLKWYKDKYLLPINNFSTHTFRKTWARNLYETELEKGKGDDALVMLSKRMNHSSLTITRHYMGL